MAVASNHRFPTVRRDLFVRIAVVGNQTDTPVVERLPEKLKVVAEKRKVRLSVERNCFIHVVAVRSFVTSLLIFRLAEFLCLVSTHLGHWRRCQKDKAGDRLCCFLSSHDRRDHVCVRHNHRNVVGTILRPAVKEKRPLLSIQSCRYALLHKLDKGHENAAHRVLVYNRRELGDSAKLWIDHARDWVPT